MIFSPQMRRAVCEFVVVTIFGLNELNKAIDDARIFAQSLSVCEALRWNSEILTVISSRLTFLIFSVLRLLQQLTLSATHIRQTNWQFFFHRMFFFVLWNSAMISFITKIWNFESLLLIVVTAVRRHWISSVAIENHPRPSLQFRLYLFHVFRACRRSKRSPWMRTLQRISKTLQRRCFAEATRKSFQRRSWRTMRRNFPLTLRRLLIPLEKALNLRSMEWDLWRDVGFVNGVSMIIFTFKLLLLTQSNLIEYDVSKKWYNA